MLVPPRVRGKFLRASKPKETSMNWMTKDWTQGESNALVKKLGGDDVARGILNDTVKFTIVETPAPSTLSPFVTVSTTITETRDPDNFFCDRSGLYVWGDYRNRIVNKAKPVEKGMVLTAKHAELERDATDKDIELALGEDHIWEEGALCAFIAQCISEQEGGKSGVLLNSGYANLFYTSSCVVLVDWDADRRKWYVNTWRRDGNRWSAGDRAVSPATN